VPTVLRVIVGASGSPASLRALRYAQHLAHDYDATLVPVLAWLPPCGDLADRRTPDEELRRIWAQDAHQQLQGTLNLAWGTLPVGLSVWPLVRRGQPGPVLAGAARHPGDLLVVGACPVLVLPVPPLAHQAPHGALARAFWRRTLTADQVSPGKRRAAA